MLEYINQFTEKSRTSFRLYLIGSIGSFLSLTVILLFFDFDISKINLYQGDGFHIVISWLFLVLVIVLAYELIQLVTFCGKYMLKITDEGILRSNYLILFLNKVKFKEYPLQRIDINSVREVGGYPTFPRSAAFPLMQENGKYETVYIVGVRKRELINSLYDINSKVEVVLHSIK